MFEIAEHATDRQRIPHLLIELPLSLVLYVVDGEARHDDVEYSERWQRLLKIVCNDLHASICVEALVQPFEHGRREIQCDSDSLWPGAQHKVQEAAVTGAKVQNTLNGFR